MTTDGWMAMRLHFPKAFGVSLALAALAPAAVGQGQSPAARAPVSGAPARVTAFVEVNVVPMDTERLLTEQTVLVEGGRITALGPTSEVTVPKGARRIDGRGKYLIPGLADMHIHSFTLNSEKDMLRLLAQGVTTVRYMGWSSENKQMLQWRAQAAAGERLSPRIYATGPWMTSQDYQRGRGSVFTWHIAPSEVTARVAAHRAAGYDFIKPHSESREIFDSVTAAARRLGIPVAGHVPPQVPIEHVLASGGMQSIEHLTGYVRSKTDIAHGAVPGLDSLADDAQIRALADATRRAGVWNTPTLGIVEAAAGMARADNLLSTIRRIVKALQDAGAGLLLGTDRGSEGAAVMAELVALVRAGLTPYQALVTGTRNVAAYFGTLDETGTVAVGKRADLVLLSGNPLVDVAAAAQPDGVMLAGRWLARAELDRRLAEGTATPE